MKKLILTATFLFAGVFSMLAQGEMDFSNAPWEGWPDPAGIWDRAVYKAPGVPVDDATWYAQLVQSADGGATWTRVGGPTTFFGNVDPSVLGIWQNDGVKRVPTVATVAVEIYDGANNMLYRGAGALPGGQDRPSFQYVKGNSSPPSPADTLPINLGAIIVPEPSTIALGVLGLGALLLFRRRK